MARLKLDQESNSEFVPLKSAGLGVFVVIDDINPDWIGDVVIVADGATNPIRLSPSCNRPYAFDKDVATAMRVRPLRPGEKLVCVE